MFDTFECFMFLSLISLYNWVKLIEKWPIPYTFEWYKCTTYYIHSVNWVNKNEWRRLSFFVWICAPHSMGTIHTNFIHLISTDGESQLLVGFYSLFIYIWFWYELCAVCTKSHIHKVNWLEKTHTRQSVDSVCHRIQWMKVFRNVSNRRFVDDVISIVTSSHLTFFIQVNGIFT